MKRLSLLALSMLLTCTLFAADIFLRGSVNSWGTSDDFKFSTSDNVVYTLEKSFDLFGEFKFADAAWGDHNYGSDGTAVATDASLSLVKGGANFNCGTNSYKVTKIVLNISEMTAVISGEGGELEITSRTVAGDSEAIFGKAWDPENTTNDMVKNGNTWKLVKENVSLVSGTEYLFKIVANHAWGVSDYPEDSSNASFTVSQSGTYDVNFEYDETTNTGKAYATKKSDPTPATYDSYILIGDGDLFVFDWTPSPIGVEMFTLATTDGIHYTKTVENVPINKTGEFAYGFSKNGSTTDILFKDKSKKVTIEEAGVYNISVSLTVASGEEPEVEAVLTKVVPPTTTYYITGNGDAETDWCCGESWNPAGCAMESGYFTRDLPAGEYKFKITQGDWEKQSWGYDAVDASQSTAGYTKDDDGNVVFTLDKKSTVAVKFDGSKIILQWTAKDEPQPEFDTWTLVGDMPPFPAAWDATMTAFDLQTTDGVVYTLVADDVDMSVAQFQYGFRKNHTNEYAPLEEKYKVSLTEGVGSYKVEITLDFTDASDPQVEVVFTKNVTPTYDYYIAGNGDGLNGWTCGITWDPAGCGMAEGQYKAHVQPGTYEFKVTDGTWDNAWGIESVDATQSTPGYEGTDNVKFSVSSEANITVSFDGTSIILLSDVPFGEATIDVWSVVGDAALGLVWTPATTTDDMALVGGAYQLVKTGLVLEAGDYAYKFTANHQWGVQELPASGNFTLTIPEDGTYKVTFRLNATGTEGSAEAEKQVDPGFDTWTLVGDMPPFPAAWTVEPAFDLTTTDGVVYTLVADDVDMTVDKFQYGFRKNHTEDFAPLEAKYTATLAEGTGSYKVEITLDFTDASDPQVEVVFTKNVTPTYDYYIAGNGWTCDLTWVADGCGMAEGQYKAHVQPGTYEFKVTDGTWDNTWGIESVDATQSTPGYEGTDNVKFSVSSEANITVSFDGTSIILLSDVPFGEATITSWTAVGEAGLFENAWTPTDESNDMQFVGGVYQLVKTGLTLEAKDYLYKFTANHTWSVSEIPSGNATLTIEEAGTYKVTFSLNPATGEYSAVPEKETPTSADEAVEDSIYATSGTVYCSTPFEVYNLVGQNVTAQNGSLFGIYIVKTANTVKTVSVK